ncbi:MAG: GerW family sporulation protein [Eubacteriales bacterium]|jgi:sporulation protein YtfJ|nr:sporulation protein YtfJ [Clostridiales bacterium]
MNSENNKISEIIKTSLENIRTVVDANTIIGDPISTPNGITILPVSRVSIGFASGGFDYLGKNAAKTNSSNKNNFGGGGGSGLTVDPVAFLIISPDGKVDLVPIDQNAGPKSDIATIIENVPVLIDKIKSLFPKKKKDSDKSDNDCEEENKSDG